MLTVTINNLQIPYFAAHFMISLIRVENAKLQSEDQVRYISHLSWIGS